MDTVKFLSNVRLNACNSFIQQFCMLWDLHANERLRSRATDHDCPQLQEYLSGASLNSKRSGNTIILSIKNHDIAQRKSHAQLFPPLDGAGHENKATWITAGA